MSRYGKTDPEMTFMKEEVFTHSFLETEGVSYGGDMWQSTVGLVAEGTRGKGGQEPVLRFLWDWMGKAELASLHNFSGLWGVRSVPSWGT